MGKRTEHPPGTLSWTDLATTDAAAAKTFYTELFGWATEDGDAGGGAVYTTCRSGGDAVCGIFAMTEEMAATGMPPNWTSYVTVADTDAAVARAGELGGRAVRPAFDVLDVGRMAVLADPQGAVFAVWEPRGAIGAERVNDLGCMCMNELATTDIDAAGRFYGGLFGWTTETTETGPGGPPLVSALNDGRLNASISLVEDGSPPHWRPYFTVDSTASTMRRVRGLGGSELLAPLEIGDGSIALALDPQGALFGVFAGEVDD